MTFGSLVSVWALRRLVLALALASAAGALSCSSGDGAVPPKQANVPPLDRPCNTDSECPGQRCDPLHGCVACLFDWDCGDQARCADGACQTRVSCKSSSDCVPAVGPVCDPVAQTCTQCVASSDCPKDSRCEENHCIAYTPCVNSLDCPTATVCNREKGECVGCTEAADCAPTQACDDKTCVARCASDKDCQAAGLLCGPGGFCVQCVEQVDCPSIYHCTEDGSCKLDVCEVARPTCDPKSESVLNCNPTGDAVLPTQCSFGQSCEDTGNGARCTTWLCQPFQWKCVSPSK